MTPNEIASEVQAQLLTAVQTVQKGVVSTLDWVTVQAETRLPETKLPERLTESVMSLTSRIPEATPYIDRGFEAAEQFLRTQHDFATKIAGAFKPSA